jgi:hypothetical protein
VLERCQSEIGRVLVPGDVVLAAGRLQPDRVKHQDIRPDYGLHQVQDADMAHQLGRPGKQQVRFHPVRGVALQTVRVLIAEHERLGAGAQAVIAKARRLCRRQQPSSRQIAVPPIEFDFFRDSIAIPVDQTASRLNACLGGTGNITNLGCEEPSCGAPRTHGRTSAARMSRGERTIQLAVTGDRLNSSAPIFADTPDFWPVPASESGPQLLTQ